MKTVLTTLVGLLILMNSSLADERSGPGRTTLASFDGGTIYAADSKITSTKTGPGETILQTSAGKIVVRTTPWGYDIVGPQGTVKVSTSLNELTIEEGKKKYQVVSAFGGKTTFSFPGQKITFQQDGFDQATVSGPKGTLKVEEAMNELKLTSPAGTTVYSGQLNSAKPQGPPFIRHPYTYRAFLIERNGVGILLNLMPYQHEALKPLLDWTRVQYY